MAHDLADLFAEQRTTAVTWQNGLIYSLYEFDEVPERFSVEFVSSISSPIQGLNLKVRNGLLVVNEVEASDIILWRDSAPDMVNVHLKRRAKDKVTLKAWNVWRSATDVIHAWLGNAAMRVSATPGSNTVELYCSDGEGPPSFEDLIVRLKRDGPATL